MKKICTIMVVALALVAGAACGGGSDDNRPSKAECLESASLMIDGLKVISEGAVILDYESEEVVDEYLANADSFIDTSVVAMKACAYLGPEAAEEVLDDLDVVKDEIAKAKRNVSVSRAM